MSLRSRSTKSKTGSRRSHHSISFSRLTKEGDMVRLRHRATLEDGVYRGAKITNKGEKRKEKLANKKAVKEDNTETKQTEKQIETKNLITDNNQKDVFESFDQTPTEKDK